MDSSPPPAYVEQEFDQKVSTALQVSLSAPQPPLRDDEEEWEEWDDAAFNAAAQAVSSLGSHGVIDSRSSHGLGLASSSRPQESHPPERKGGDVQSHNPSVIEPLRIHKKTPSSPSRSKPRPIWLSETQVDAQSSASGSIRHEIPPDDQEDHSIPPPPFTEVAPSLDGRPMVVLSYQPSGDSRPPSPLNSPIQMPLQIPVPYGRDSAPLSRPSSRTQPDQPEPSVEQFHANSQAASWSHRPTRQSLPGIRPLPNPHAQQRPSTIIMSSSKRPQAPRMNFNPYVAYGQSGGISESPTQYAGRQINPSELYNSAVSSHLSSARTPARRSYSPSSPGHQNNYHSNPASFNPGHHSVFYDRRPTTANQLPTMAVTSSSRVIEPWPSCTSAEIPVNVYPMNPYSQVSMDNQYPQNRPG